MAFTIDGLTYDMPCSISRKANVKSSSLSGDLLDGTYYNDVIGTYLSYDIQLAVPTGMERKYAELYEVLTNPVGEHEVTVPYNQGTITFICRIENVSDKYYRQEGTTNIWRGISFSVTASEPNKISTEDNGVSITRGILGTKSITENGIYSAQSEGLEGFTDVTVDVQAKLGTKEITANGTYKASDDSVDGFSTVDVNVTPNLSEKTITAMGIYKASDDSVTGYSSVSVMPSEGEYHPLVVQYINSGVFYPTDSSATTQSAVCTLCIFPVSAGHTYFLFLGSKTGTCFRAAYFSTNPIDSTSNVTGTAIGSDLENPAAYTSRDYTAMADGYVVVETDTSSNPCHAYCLDITAVGASA